MRSARFSLLFAGLLLSGHALADYPEQNCPTTPATNETRRNLELPYRRSGTCPTGGVALRNFDAMSSPGAAIGFNADASLNLVGVAGVPPCDGAGTTTLGLRNADMYGCSTEPGCTCEGWSAGAFVGGSLVSDTEVKANTASGDWCWNIASSDWKDGDSPASTPTNNIDNSGSKSAKSTITTSGGLRIVHDVRESPSLGKNWFDFTITMTNTNSAGSFDAVKYRRFMDFDVSPTPFRERISILGRTTTTSLEYSSDNGFWGGGITGSSGYYNYECRDGVDTCINSGPSDHGGDALFNLGALAAGESVTFVIAYGFTNNYVEMEDAMGAFGAEFAIIGKNGNTDFDSKLMFAMLFRGVGGEAIVKCNVTSAITGPTSGPEGSSIELSGSSSTTGTAGATINAYSWIIGGAVVSTDATYSLLAEDDGPIEVTLTVTNSLGCTDSTTTIVTVTNVAPVAGVLSFPMAPVPVGTSVSVSFAFTDAGLVDTHTVVCDFAGAAQAGVVTQGSGSGSVSATGTFLVPDLYAVTCTVTDDDGGSHAVTTVGFIPVYDASAGHVTGGGQFDSPAGAYVLDPTWEGVCRFAFVCKYIPGMQQPEGQNKLWIHKGSLDFRASSFEYLLVQGASSKAKMRGQGTLKNDATIYQFMTTIYDAGGGAPGEDRYHTRIWKEEGAGSADTLVFDNEPEKDSGSWDLSTNIKNGGGIVIHA